MILLSRSEELVLLAIWKLGANAYGVTIKDELERVTNQEWSFGAIYKPLKQLTIKNYVRKTESGPIAERGGRAKFLYTLTKMGEEALREMNKINQAAWDSSTKVAFE